MSQGDSVVDVITVSGGSAVTVQPAAGETWKLVVAGGRLTEFGWAIEDNLNSDIIAEWYDGTSNEAMATKNKGSHATSFGGKVEEESGNNNVQASFSPLINNTWYLRLNNTSCSSFDGGYSGTQIK